MVSAAEPLLVDLDLLAQDEWTPTVTKAGASLDVLEGQVTSVSAAIERFNALASQTSEPLAAVGESGQAAASGLDAEASAASSAAGENQALLDALASLQGQMASLETSTEDLIQINQMLVVSEDEAAVAIEANTVALGENAAASGTADTKARSFGSGGLLSVHTMAMLGATAVAGLTVETLRLGAGLETADAKLVSFAGVGQQEIAGINQSLLTMSSQTGEAPRKLAQGLYFIESAGYAGAGGMHILEQSTHLAMAAQTDAKTVADVATSALKAYGLSASDVGHVLDVLTATTVAGKMEFSDLAGSLGRVLPVAAQSGVSLEQVGAAIATMTQKGLSADEAVTAVRGMLLNLEAPSKQTRTELESLGLTADQVRQSIRDKGLLATLSDLIDRAHGNMDALHNLIPNVRALTGALADAGTSGKDYQAALDGIQNSQGKAAAAWQNYEQTASASMDRLKGTILADLTEIGGSADKALQPAIDSLNKLLGLVSTPGSTGANIVGRGASFLYGLTPMGQIQNEISGAQGIYGDLQNGDYAAAGFGAAAEAVRIFPILGPAAAQGLGFLEDKFRSGTQASREYATGVQEARNALQGLASNQTNPFMQRDVVNSTLEDLYGQQRNTLAALDAAKHSGNKTAVDDIQKQADLLRGQIQGYLDDLTVIDQKVQSLQQKATLEPDFTRQEQQARLAGRDTPQNQPYLQDLAAAASTPIPTTAIDNLRTAVQLADAAEQSATLHLNELLNKPNAQQNDTNLQLALATQYIDGLDIAIAKAVPNSAEYNHLIQQRADYYNNVIGPLTTVQKAEGDTANAIKLINQEYQDHAISADQARAALDQLASGTQTYKGVVVEVSAADQQQIDAERRVIDSHEQAKAATDQLVGSVQAHVDASGRLEGILPGVGEGIDSVRAASENAVPSIEQIGAASQTTATKVAGASDDMKTDLGSVGDARPDLSGYEGDLVGKAAAAGAAARAAIEAQLANIQAQAAVNIVTHISQDFGPSIPAVPAGSPTGFTDSAPAGVPMSMLALTDATDEGDTSETDTGGRLSYMSSGPKPPPTPKPGAIHVSPKPPAVANGSPGGRGGRSGGGSGGTRGQAQAIAAEHQAMRADAQDIQNQVNEALAEFDALVHPDGKNALLARLTADLTSSDSVAGIADAERILFREAVVSGSSGVNASADQLVQSWLSAASKGITDPAKLDQLRSQAQQMLSALADVMPDVASTVATNKQIDLASAFFGQLANPDAVKSLEQRALSVLKEGQPDGEEAIRHMLFGDGIPTDKQAKAASQVATGLRDDILKNIDLNDPNSIALAQQRLATLYAALQDEANRLHLTIPVDVGAGGSGGISPDIGSGGLTPPSSRQTPEDAEAQGLRAVDNITGNNRDAHFVDDLAQQVADAITSGKVGTASALLAKAGTRANVQKVFEKAQSLIQSLAEDAGAKVQQLNDLTTAGTFAAQVAPHPLPNEDQVTDRTIQAELNPGSAESRQHYLAQQVADAIKRGDTKTAQALLASSNRKDFQGVVSEARQILKDDAAAAGTATSELDQENHNLNTAATSAAPTAGSQMSPEEQQAQRDKEEKAKHTPGYYSSPELEAQAQAANKAGNKEMQDDVVGFIEAMSKEGYVGYYNAEMLMHAQENLNLLTYQNHLQEQILENAKLQAEYQKTHPVVVHAYAMVNGRIVGAETTYYSGQQQEMAALGMPQGGRG